VPVRRESLPPCSRRARAPGARRGARGRQPGWPCAHVGRRWARSRRSARRVRRPPRDGQADVVVVPAWRTGMHARSAGVRAPMLAQSCRVPGLGCIACMQIRKGPAGCRFLFAEGGSPSMLARAAVLKGCRRPALVCTCTAPTSIFGAAGNASGACRLPSCLGTRGSIHQAVLFDPLQPAALSLAGEELLSVSSTQPTHMGFLELQQAAATRPFPPRLFPFSSAFSSSV